VGKAQAVNLPHAEPQLLIKLIESATRTVAYARHLMPNTEEAFKKTGVLESKA
jgi:hypothetical protein